MAIHLAERCGGDTDPRGRGSVLAEVRAKKTAKTRQVPEQGKGFDTDEDGVPIELHLVMDNYAAHKHANVRAWLTRHPRFVVHFTPTHASWMNLVEVWFGIV